MRQSKELKAAVATFRSRAIAIFERCGAVATDNGNRYPYVVLTGGGLLELAVNDASIFGCFDDEKLGHIITGRCLSRYATADRINGKWNFHFHCDPTTLGSDTVLTEFALYLDRIVAYRPTTEDVALAERIRREDHAPRAALATSHYSSFADRVAGDIGHAVETLYNLDVALSMSFTGKPRSANDKAVARIRKAVQAAMNCLSLHRYGDSLAMLRGERAA